MTERAPIVLATDLTEAGLHLRPWQPADAEALHEAVRESLDRFAPWLPWCHDGYALADAQARIAYCRESWASGEHYGFAICSLEGQLLGSVGLNQRNRNHRSANLGYWVRQSRQRQGVATQAIRLVARFGFEQLQLARVEMVIEPENLASRRAAERAGARFEAIARQRLWIRNRARDAAVYSLLRADLDQAR